MNSSKRLDVFLQIVLIVNVFILALYKISTYDFWIHLATGRYLWQTGIIPKLNTFSYTYPDFPWRYLVGPFQLILYLVYLISGIKGIIIYKALVLGLTFYFLWRISLGENIPSLGRFWILFLAAVVIRERFSERPQLWLFLFIAYYIWILSRYQKTSSPKYLIPLFPLQVLWVNTHGSFLIGLYLVGLLAAIITLKNLLIRYFPKLSPAINDLNCDPKWLWFTLFGLLIFSLLNPHTYRIFSYPFDIGSQKVALLSVAERQPISLEKWLGPYGVLMLISLLAILFGLYHRQWFFVLLLLTFAPLSWKAIRFIDVFSIVAAATLPVLLFSGGLAYITKILSKVQIIVISIIIATITTSYICLTHLTLPLGWGVNPFITPEEAMNFIEKNNIVGPIYNDIDFGDYIIWRLYPREKVFIDGRRFSAYPQEFYEKVEFLHSATPTWNALIKKYDFNVAVLTYTPIEIEKLFPPASWALVFWDDAAMVLLRRTKANETIIRENEFKYFYPNRFSDLRTKSPHLVEGFLQELRRSRDMHPNSYRVNYALGYLYSWQGEKTIDLAESYLKRAIRLCPPFAPAYTQLAQVYSSMGKYQEAIRYLKQSIKIAPDFRIAYFHLSTIYGILKDQKRAKEYYKKYNTPR